MKAIAKITTLATVVLSALLLPLGTALADVNGARLYTLNCAVCHGENGDGGVGVPLALPDFLKSVPDEYLITTIRHGRPGRVMPAFTQLSDEEVRGIVDHIRGFGKKSWRKIEHSREPVKGNAAHGKELFGKYCAACHGADGKGGPGTGVTFSRPRDLPIIAPALNNPGFLAAATDQMIKTTLMNGREGTPMVSFTDQGLKEKDINDIVSYVRSFEQQYKEAKASSKVLGEPILVYESSYSFDETVENVKRAVIGKNFRLIREQLVEEGLFDKGKENPKQKMIYFCNFKTLNDALALDPRVGLFLPCRVTVVEHKGVVQVMAINPKQLSELFNNANLNRACNEMYEIYNAILEESTL